MNKSPEELLENYLDALSNDPDAPIPVGLDSDLAHFARQLALSQRKGIQDRAWQKALLLSEAMRSSKTPPKTGDVKQPSTINLSAKRRNYFSVLLAAAALIVLAWGLIQLMRKPSGNIAAFQPTPTPLVRPSSTPSATAVLPQGHIYQLAWSPDRSLLAVACDGGVYLYQSDALDQPGRLLTGYSGPMNNVIFSPKGHMIASSNKTATVIWDVEAATVKVVLPGGTAMAFSPDDTTLAIAEPTTIDLWDIASGKKRLSWSFNMGIYSLAFSPDGRTLAAGDSYNYIHLWDVHDGSSEGKLQPTPYISRPITALAFSPDGSTLVSGGGDNYVRIWDVATETQLANRADEITGVSSVSFSADGNAVSYLGDTAWFWQFKSGKEPAFLDKDTTWRSLVFNLDNTPLALGINAGIWREWGVPSDPNKILLSGYK